MLKYIIMSYKKYFGAYHNILRVCSRFINWRHDCKCMQIFFLVKKLWLNYLHLCTSPNCVFPMRPLTSWTPNRRWIGGCTIRNSTTDVSPRRLVFPSSKYYSSSQSNFKHIYLYYCVRYEMGEIRAPTPIQNCLHLSNTFCSFSKNA